MYNPNCNYVFFSISPAAQCVSRGSNGTNALTLDQEARQRYREVNSIIGEAPTSDLRKQPQVCDSSLLRFLGISMNVV